MVFLDANPVIYLIEQPAALSSKTTARVTALPVNGERPVVSELSGRCRHSLRVEAYERLPTPGEIAGNDKTPDDAAHRAQFQGQ
jgi:hypothetical protein